MRLLQVPASQSHYQRRPRISFATLGCKVNQAETEELISQFEAAGYVEVNHGQPCDLFVLNSCSVTHIADRKSRQVIRQARRANPQAVIAVTGCFAQTRSPGATDALGADLWVANADKRRLLQIVAPYVEGLFPAPETPVLGGRFLSPRACEMNTQGIKTEIDGRGIEGEGSGSNRRTRALVKIQDGCDNYCTYCIVPTARGSQRSVPRDEVVTVIEKLVKRGYAEVVLTGVHAGAYGRESFGPAAGTDLAVLIGLILEKTAVRRLRLSSIEPWDFDRRFLTLWEDRRLCRHLHLPLQSGSETVLQRMGRRYKATAYQELVDEIRGIVPDIAITTDIMVGFPGETEEEHRESLAFCESSEFADMHVFKYSRREGTPAARMANQIDDPTKKRRSEEMIELAAASAARYRARFIGQTAEVLWETPLDLPRRDNLDPEVTTWEGLTDNYLRVYAESETPLGGMMSTVRLCRVWKDRLWAKFGEEGGRCESGS